MFSFNKFSIDKKIFSAYGIKNCKSLNNTYKVNSKKISPCLNILIIMNMGKNSIFLNISNLILEFVLGNSWMQKISVHEDDME